LAESQRHYARRFVLCVVELSLIGGVGFQPGFLFRPCLPVVQLWVVRGRMSMIFWLTLLRRLA